VSERLSREDYRRYLITELNYSPAEADCWLELVPKAADLRQHAKLLARRGDLGKAIRMHLVADILTEWQEGEP
jgi:hypothetical protein